MAAVELPRWCKVDCMRVNNGAGIAASIVLDREVRLDVVFDCFLLSKKNSKRMATWISL
jgi:hypothetical protein